MRVKNASGTLIDPRYYVRYVAPNGSNSNSGADASHPLATLAKAVELGATRIILAAGAYSEHPTLSGLHDIEIICPDWSGTATFVESRAEGSSTQLFTISGCNNLRLVNITATGGDLGSFYVGSSDNIVFERCGGHNCMRGMGFKIQGSTVLCHFCKANGNAVDGFNLHEGGYLQCVDCVADGNLDDGFSNHAGTKARYINCVAVRNKDGISPVDGAETFLLGCVCANNSGKGFQLTASAFPAPVIVANCAAYGNGTNWSVTTPVPGNLIAYNNVDGNSSFVRLDSFATS